MQFAEQQNQQEDMMVEEAPVAYRKIEELENFGVAKADITKLKAGGYHTIEAIAHNTLRKLTDVKGVSEQKAQKLKDIVKMNNLVSTGFTTATQRLEMAKDAIMISTGSQELDRLLGGGIETGSITEIFGEFRTGKTQVCHTLCVTCQRPLDAGGAEGRVIYVDTEGTFKAQKLVAIAERFGMNPEEVLDNVICARAHNSEQQLELLADAAALMSDNRYALMVVDSATALFRSDYTGRAELSERQIQLGQFLRQLTRLAEEFGIAVVITNQVVANPDGMSFAKDATKPIGGNIIAHASQTRLKFKKGRGENRICQVYDSPILPESECTFALGPGGVEDAKDL
eukprot:TRINITY_DN68091_c2_g1_i1.p1 TRINITY_DN68091_c2_g1~~TRINITY_DN68091_c2_g1_i1.p1  ORF type:complete len:342 (+),score=0.75 TRINITY_DN68091_c2_g1_i1:93-1118(+)